MTNEVESEVRPRPLSTGLWTLFSWLRRDDRVDSTESLSSAGSDRTVASFAFLTPAKYQPIPVPLVLPPPGPPTDSYKRRVHDRNLRRQYDRDLTLHRKYGLFKSSDTTCGYDAFSLPPTRRINAEAVSRWDRERRATSECFQRRLAHVPGKRRAPLPPISAIPTAPPTTLTRRNSRKRRAPQPPIKPIERDTDKNKNRANVTYVEVNTNLTAQMSHDIQKVVNTNVSMGCKSEKYSKKEGSNKDPKFKSEKCFLKQIFESKKRSSGIDISSVKVLPSISELDKQAAEIIKTSKLKVKGENNNDKGKLKTNENNNDNSIFFEKSGTQPTEQSENWICITCLRKYNSTVIDCSYCLSKSRTVLTNPNNNDFHSASKASNSYTQTERNLSYSTSTNNAAEEKQKLKEMLKEMKDSLPKRNKPGLVKQNDLNSDTISDLKPVSSYSTETPTLRVGSTIEKSNITITSTDKPPTSNIIKTKVCEIIPVKCEFTGTAQPTVPVLQYSEQNKSLVKNKNPELNLIGKPVIVKPAANIQDMKLKSITCMDNSERYKEKKDLHTPLKISSLLNPVYVPKNLNSEQFSEVNGASQTEVKPLKQNMVGEKKLCTKNVAVNNLTTLTTSPILPVQSTSQIVKIAPNVPKAKIEFQKSAPVNTETTQENPLPVSTKEDKGFDFKVNVNSKIQSPTTSASSIKVQNEKKYIPDQHSRRRDLIHQLEQSIAKGDERAAAEAAAKLAQLRVSCSVLSFSSQILSQPSTSKANIGIETDQIISNKLTTSAKHELIDKNKPQAIAQSVVKEKSPQKSFVSSITITADKVVSNLNSIPKSNAKKKQNNSTDEAKKSEENTNYEMITIAVLVEDREATKGPVHLLIKRQALMRDLRREAEASLGVATNLQRWIVGRVLCVNDNMPIAKLAGPNFSAPFYLCVVESETKTDSSSQRKIAEKLTKNTQTKVGNVYTELVELEQQALVPNTDTFECGVCMETYPPGLGVVLRECVHIFCKDCLSDVVRHCEEPDVPCPAMGCRGMLQEREIRALVNPQDYERWLARGLAAAESGTRNAFHCRTRDCKGWALCDPGVQRFPCPVCQHINCVPCQAIHDGETCEQHKLKLVQANAASCINNTGNDDGTRTLLNSLIAKGEALECPECSAIITKKWGCDWVKCSACKTEICWVTRGRRWGPGGKGDTSGGCRCGVDGRRCHPSCGYCH